MIMFVTVKELLVELLQYFQFSVLNTKYNFPLPRTINFESKVDKKNKTLLIQSPEYPGLYTIVPMNDDQKLVDMVNDAIFTYFEVPRYIARREENKFFPKNFQPGSVSQFIHPRGLAFN